MLRMEEPRWTLDELAERVETALGVDYHGQASGRVRPVPDRRAIRWYTTIGLIDRPAGHRGRTALYGPRHLLQLVAVKRLQASGLPLVSIQQELAGASDTQLARVARLPGSAAGEGGAESGTADAARSEAAATRPPSPAARRAGPAATRSAALAPRTAAGKASRARFWREQPAAAFAAAPGADTATTDPADFTPPADLAAPARPSAPADPAAATAPVAPLDPPAATAPVVPTAPVAPTAPDPPAGPPALGRDQTGPAQAATVQGVRLGDGATLLLEPGRGLGPADVQAILGAARPLLAVLRERGLGGGLAGPGLDPDAPRAGGNEPRREHQ
jgi:DNA-binding transcriptional MerR regulator